MNWGRSASTSATSMQDASRTTETLLADFGWLRALARKLVADEHLAEDLAQDAVVSALEQSGGAAPSRAWLASVLRNGLRHFARGEGHRRARELATARAQVRASPSELLETLEAHRELLEALRELPEPYRAAVTLRFLRGLPPRRIARELGISAATASSRVTGGVRILRERLTARQRGGSSAWMALLVPLAFEARTPATGLLGFIAVNTKLVAAASIIVLATVLAVFALRDDAAEPSNPTLAAAETLARESASASDAESLADAEERATAPASEAPSASVVHATGAAAPPAARTIRGRVFDASGAVFANATLTSPEALEGAALVSGRDGWFELATRAESGSVECSDPRWVTVRAGVFSVNSANAPIVIAARSIEVAGSIRDDAGRELRGARIALHVPRAFETRFPQSLEGTRPLGWFAASSANGTFRLEHLPAIEGAELSVALDGYEPWRAPAPLETRLDLAIELARPRTPLAGALSGSVRNATREPIAGARVAIGLACATTDDEGQFTLDLARAASAEELRAVAAGYAPALIPRPFEPRDGDLGWPKFIDVVLPAEALTLRGRVVDHEERPVANVRISLADPSHFGTIGMMPASTEALAAGAPVPPQAVASIAQLPEDDGDNFYDMFQSVGPSTAFWHWVETDGDGRFELPGLATRAYRVKVLDPKTLLSFVSDRLSALDGEATIRLPRPRVWESVAGRVVSRFGDPLRDVTLTPVHEAYGVRSRIWGGNVYVSLRDRTEAVRTDEHGRFELAHIPREGVHLDLNGAGIVPLEYALDDVKEPRALEIVVDVRCQVEVVLEEPFDRADSVAVVDKDGRGLDAFVITEGHVNAYTDLPLVNGRSAVFSASSQAAEIVLLKDEEVVARQPIRLVPGAPNVLRL